MNTILITSAVLCLATQQTWAFPSGAPTGTCVTMQPSVAQHGANGQPGAAPYTIMHTYDQNMDRWSVQIMPTGTAPLPKGLILQARKTGSTTPWGTFQVDTTTPSKLLMCTAAGDTLTHSMANNGSNFNTYWTPPAGDSGMGQFVATIVQTRMTYWVQHMSAALTVTAPTAAAPPAGTDTTTEGGSSAVIVSGMLTTVSLLLAKLTH